MKVTVKGNCPSCGAEWQIEVEEKDYLDFTENGKLAQHAFPYLSAEDRELIISGICNNCWEVIFSDDEDELDN